MFSVSMLFWFSSVKTYQCALRKKNLYHVENIEKQYLVMRLISKIKREVVSNFMERKNHVID